MEEFMGQISRRPVHWTGSKKSNHLDTLTDADQILSVTGLTINPDTLIDAIDVHVKRIHESEYQANSPCSSKRPKAT
jgi:hypothetical protein